MSVYEGMLVPLSGPEALQPNGVPFSARGGIRLAGEGLGLYAFVALAWHDRRQGVAAYALRVVNGTVEPARCYCFEVRANEVAAEIYPMPLVAAANSVMDTFVFVRTDRRDALRRLIVDVAACGAALRVEAPPPPQRRPHAHVLLGWSLSLLLLVLAVTVAATAALPRLTVFEPPSRATAGTVLEVPFAYRGAGMLQYSLGTSDGRTIAANMLDTRVGIVRVPLPKESAGQTYRLSVRAVGPLGTDTRGAAIAITAPTQTKRVRREAPPADGAALIGELSVTPAPALAGRDVHVNYIADATSGTIWLLDLAGRAWASAPYSSQGSSILRIPPTAAGREMRVVLQVERGVQRASSSVGIVVQPSGAQPAAPAVATAVPAARQSADIELSQSSVMAGQSVHVRITGPHDDAQITLTDTKGQTIEEGDASGQDRGLMLTAPAVDAPTIYYVVASITSGVAQTSLVRKLVVMPAR
ncbi:hypothetical protein EPN52_07615 [bacterium]|nr:MAG: hypothetical protein EPN52_07615 [bacterium]